MLKNFFGKILSVILLGFSFEFALATEQVYLNSDDRPLELRNIIDEAFTDVNRPHVYESNWGLFNGEDIYNICHVNEHQLLKSIIMKETERKDFYILDIGAGNFQWGETVAKFLQSQTELPYGITIHIFGIRGEKHTQRREHENQDSKIKVQQHQLGSFKIEEMCNQFAKNGFDFNEDGKGFDLIVSRWTLRHLADPVGTLAQAYNILHPTTGIMLFDRFWFMYGNTGTFDKELGILANKNMLALLVSLKASFLVMPWNDTATLNHYIMRKSDNSPCQIPLTYDSAVVVSKKGEWNTYQIGSRCMTKFKEPQPNIFFPDEICNSWGYYLSSTNVTHYGDNSLFDWIMSNENNWKDSRDQYRLTYVDGWSRKNGYGYYTLKEFP